VRVAVVVVWDGRRQDWLKQALASIDAQRPAATQKCLVIDGADGENLAGDLDVGGWLIKGGNWQDPAAARNEGMNATDAPWLVFWDADNVMAAGFLGAVSAAVDQVGHEVGVVYSDINYVDEQLANGHVWVVPEFDYWTLRAGNYIDAGSAWRRMAVELSGGWPEDVGSFEDYALALEVTRRGWKAQRRDGPPVTMRVRSSSSAQEDSRNDQRWRNLWRLRSIGIVSLLAGRISTYERWEGFLHTAELPRHTGLYLVDNSGDPDFGSRVQHSARELATARHLDHVCVLVRPRRYDTSREDGYFYRDRHLHIAQLYAEVLPTVTEDMVLTLEDDVEPPADAIRRLSEHLACSSSGNHAAVAAAYDMGDDALCAGRADGGWGSRIPWNEVGSEPIDVGSVGGGCTLWANWTLAAAPVTFEWHKGLGWDGSMCSDLRRRGYGVQVHGGVRCTHHVHGLLQR
jgi:hypothetical protein